MRTGTASVLAILPDFGLGVFYSLFAGGFALGFRSWWPLVTFWLLTLNRLLGVVLGQAPKGKEGDFVKAGWAAGALFYLLSVMAATIIPWPRLGVRPGMVGDLAASSGGQWVDEPHRALVAAVLYFGLITWTGANGFAWFAKNVAKGP